MHMAISAANRYMQTPAANRALDHVNRRLAAVRLPPIGNPRERHPKHVKPAGKPCLVRCNLFRGRWTKLGARRAVGRRLPGLDEARLPVHAPSLADETVVPNAGLARLTFRR
jgi:hypothetical protein